MNMNIDKKQLNSLLTKLKYGEGKAFEKIYNSTRESAYFTAYKILGNRFDAENVLQDSYASVLRATGEIENADDLLERLYCSVAENSGELLTLYKRPLFALDYTGEPDNSVDENSDLIPDSDDENTAIALTGLVDGLNPDERAAFVLCTHCGLSPEKAAKAFGTTENAILLCLESAKKELSDGVSIVRNQSGIGEGVSMTALMKWAMRGACALEASEFITSGASDSVLAAIASLADSVKAPKPVTKPKLEVISEKKEPVTEPEPENKSFVKKSKPVPGPDYFEQISVKNNNATLWKAVAGILTAIIVAVAAAYVKTNGLPGKNKVPQPNTISPDNTTEEYTGETSFDSVGTKEYYTGTYVFDDEHIVTPDSETTTQEDRTTTESVTQKETTTESATTNTTKQNQSTAKPKTTAKTTQADTTKKRTPHSLAPRTTKATTGSETSASVTETTTTTTAPTTAGKSATVKIKIKKDGKTLNTISVSVPIGKTFTQADALAAAGSYDTTGADVAGAKLPLTPTAEKTYNITVTLV